MTTTVDTLNEVTTWLIDSRDGYDKMIEVVDGNYLHGEEFRRRRSERDALISEFQSKIRDLGGEPEKNGSTLGAMHRQFANLSSIFVDDETAALKAIDDGEGRLAEELEQKLQSADLTEEARRLLQRALSSARDGERFADSLS